MAKVALRDQLLASRKRLPLSVLVERAQLLAEHLLAAPEVRRAATVALYVSVSSEPGSGPLLEGLALAGKRVILPVLQPDFDLDWGVYSGPAALHTARRGLLEPDGPTLGSDAIGLADAVLVPGMAVDRNGTRLGQGGGCYDRALQRVPADTFVCVLLNSEEILDSVPHEDHDRRVSAVATEEGITRFS